MNRRALLAGSAAIAASTVAEAVSAEEDYPGHFGGYYVQHVPIDALGWLAWQDRCAVVHLDHAEDYDPAYAISVDHQEPMIAKAIYPNGWWFVISPNWNPDRDLDVDEVTAMYEWPAPRLLDPLGD